MTAIAASVAPASGEGAKGELSLMRLYVLRATYALIALGAGSIMIPDLFVHAPLDRGVIPSLLGALSLMCLFGLRYPRAMLPLLLFEFAWKAIWILAYALSQWSNGQMPPTFEADLTGILFGAILMPIVIPWGYVWRTYVMLPGDRWR